MFRRIASRRLQPSLSKPSTFGAIACGPMTTTKLAFHTSNLRRCDTTKQAQVMNPEPTEETKQAQSVEPVPCKAEANDTAVGDSTKETEKKEDAEMDDILADLDKDLDLKGEGAADEDLKFDDKDFKMPEGEDDLAGLGDMGDLDGMGGAGGNDDPRQLQRALKSLTRDFGEVHERAKLPLSKYEMHIIKQVDEGGEAVSLYELNQTKLNAFCEPLGFSGKEAAAVFDESQEFGIQRGATFDNAEKLHGAAEVEAYVIFHTRHHGFDPERIRAVVKAAVEHHNITDPPPKMDEGFGGMDAGSDEAASNDASAEEPSSPTEEEAIPTESTAETIPTEGDAASTAEPSSTTGTNHKPTSEEGSVDSKAASSADK